MQIGRGGGAPSGTPIACCIAAKRPSSTCRPGAAAGHVEEHVPQPGQGVRSSVGEQVDIRFAISRVDQFGMGEAAPQEQVVCAARSRDNAHAFGVHLVERPDG